MVLTRSWPVEVLEASSADREKLLLPSCVAVTIAAFAPVGRVMMLSPLPVCVTGAKVPNAESAHDCTVSTGFWAGAGVFSADAGALLVEGSPAKVGTVACRTNHRVPGIRRN